MKKVLITGANGFIGSNLIKSLGDKYEFYGMDRMPSKMLDQDHSFICDISEFEKVHEIFEKVKPDVLIHLAAIVHKNNADTSERNYDFINYECARNLFDECVKYDTYIIFSSTIEVYGKSDEKIITEETPCNPLSFYAKAKYKAEEYLRNNEEKMRYSILRFAAAYGKEFTLNVDKRVFLKKDKIAYYFKDGEYSFSFCSVNNICDFIDYLIKHETKNDVYNISDTESTSIKKMIDLHKRYGELKIVIHMPYYICSFLISCIEWISKILRKKDFFLSRRNFNKLFESKVYWNKKVNELCPLKWNIENTLYGDE